MMTIQYNKYSQISLSNKQQWPRAPGHTLQKEGVRKGFEKNMMWAGWKDDKASWKRPRPNDRVCCQCVSVYGGVQAGRHPSGPIPRPSHEVHDREGLWLVPRFSRGALGYNFRFLPKVGVGVGLTLPGAPSRHLYFMYYFTEVFIREKKNTVPQVKTTGLAQKVWDLWGNPIFLSLGKWN